MRGLKAFYTQQKVSVIYLILFPFLFLLSGVYAFFLYGKGFLYRKGILKVYRPKAKVISIGNITLGGSGKTPLVEYLAAFLIEEGHRVAILSRGYKRPGQKDSLGSEDYDAYGDEASMLKQNFHNKVAVLTGNNRVKHARSLDEKNFCDTIILDDGFQHWKLKRDLDIVTIDATNPFGNGLLLPAGHLRENVSSLKRADCFCLTRSDEAPERKVKELESRLLKINSGVTFIRSIHTPESLYHLKTHTKEGLDILKDSPLCLLCGIANPFSFMNTVQKLGGRIILKRFFEDHHDYSEGEITALVKKCIPLGIERIVTTEKDSQRLAGLVLLKDLGLDILVLRVVLKLTSGKEALIDRLHSLYLS